MLEYCRGQNSGYPLQGRVFVGVAEADEVDVAVALVALPVVPVCPPTSTSGWDVVVLTVIALVLLADTEGNALDDEAFAIEVITFP